jgi:hypothetical protein
MPRNPEHWTIPFAAGHAGLRFASKTLCISLSDNSFSVDLLSVTPSHDQARHISASLSDSCNSSLSSPVSSRDKSVSSLLLELWDKQIVSGTWSSSDYRAFAFHFYLGSSPSFLEDSMKAWSRSAFHSRRELP